MPPILILIGSWLSITGGIYGLFNKAGEVLTKDTRRSISKWLKSLDFESELPNWPSMFARIFDWLFTRSHLSWKCFFRSCIASLLAVISITLFALTIKGKSFFELLPAEGTEGFVALFFFASFLNLIPDYLSLFETRLVISWMSRTKTIFVLIVFLIVDLIITILIFFIAIVLLDEAAMRQKKNQK